MDEVCEKPEILKAVVKDLIELGSPQGHDLLGDLLWIPVMKAYNPKSICPSERETLLRGYLSTLPTGDPGRARKAVGLYAYFARSKPRDYADHKALWDELLKRARPQILPELLDGIKRNEREPSLEGIHGILSDIENFYFDEPEPHLVHYAEKILKGSKGVFP